MPDVKKVLVIGSGPIIIGQSAEFDYSGTQACRALKEEKVFVVLVNSNPATIQTDRQTADAVYIEPLDIKTIEKIIINEGIDSILATCGGQTALNLAVELEKKGILEKYNVKLIGTDFNSIEKAESRELFNSLMKEIGIPILESYSVKDHSSAYSYAEKINYPVIVRPAFTLGGSGGGFANNETELKNLLDVAFKLSMNHEVLIERSVKGWEEFEYEIVRDSGDNCIVICNMENFDPMGIHTGESIVVAPSQTLSDKEHQRFRDASIKIVRALEIQGSCNVQFAYNRKTREYSVIEVNPRLSRSSALASKATGYPIARIAAKIAIGKTLNEIINPIIGKTSSLEPSLDYITVKIPRWPFDKFSSAKRTLGTQMKSTGEVMAIGRSFEEALLKAVAGLEIKIPVKFDYIKHLEPATNLRLFALFDAFRDGKTIEEIYSITKINRWFLKRIEKLILTEKKIENETLTKENLSEYKKLGISDLKIASLKGKTEENIRNLRKSFGIIPVYKMVDSCSGEFEAITPYFYSTYESENEAVSLKKKKVIIIGSGPIRIGQGIEFDYCCSQASFALKKMGIESVMINNNPETVSTDFDSSSRLYFEPLDYESVLNIIENELDENLLGVIVQLGGQTSIKLAEKLKDRVKILGTSFESIDIAEDREKFKDLMDRLKIKQPPSLTVRKKEEAFDAAQKLGYPIIVRPSYVIAGRGMQIVFSLVELEKYIDSAIELSEDKPVLIDKYLDNAIECEVDAVCDGSNVFIGGVMEHIEFAGVHSGDANIVIPSLNLSYKIVEKIKKYTREISLSLGITGFLNIQFAVKDNEIYILEANPRASRTVPFLSKSIDISLVKLAVESMLGEKLLEKERKITHYAVKGVVFPFLKLPGEDILLGPEMKSTGESMGIGSDFESAYYKALKSSGICVASKGCVLLTVRKEDRKEVLEIARKLHSLGFILYATPGTAFELREIGEIRIVNKLGNEKESYDIIELIDLGKIDLVINIPSQEEESYIDGFIIRRKSIEFGIPCITNIRTAVEFVEAIEKYSKEEYEIRRFYDYE
ncbi:MAG: carbamoyl-phosphate synthase large subunit [Candidatus Micrarchaeia archaeon]